MMMMMMMTTTTKTITHFNVGFVAFDARADVVSHMRALLRIDSDPRVVDHDNEGDAEVDTHCVAVDRRQYSHQR